VDINSDGVGDIHITAAEFSRNDPAMGVLLRFDTSSDLGILDAGIAGGNPAAPPSPGGGSADTPVGNASSTTVIFASSNAYPFTLQASFQGYCMFRWEILRERDRPNRQEEYLVRTDVRAIPQIQNGVRIWVSNAMAVKLEVIGGGRTVPLEIGSAGEVVVGDIRWVRDDDGRYRLLLVRLD
jgi:hypothetical protein